MISEASLAVGPEPVPPNYDREKHKGIIYTMATCHSLKVVDGELLGDPLEVKMFQFTGWSYEEGENRVLEQSNMQFGTIAPSVAKPLVGSHIDDSANVGFFFFFGVATWYEFLVNSVFRRPPRNLGSSRPLNLSLNFAVRALLSNSSVTEEQASL